jgi:SNF2 family DNA or RNA helicase
LMGFAMPGALGNRANFTKYFDKSVDPLARRRLAARVRPFLLRRTKSEVAPELPPRTEEDLICEMTDEQAVLYRAELKRAQQMLLKIQSRKQFDKERFNFLTSLLRLRQISCDPGLLGKQGSGVTGAKVEALTDLLEPLMEEGHKVLVFSQFVTMIDRLTPVLAERGWKHFVLTGQTEDRGELVREFQNHEGSAVFMISLKAGGFGLNLTAASYVVLFDPWWNPAVESQAIDRTHRIGQTRHVMAYRLIMKGTIEEKIRKLQQSKSALATDVLGEEGFAKAITMDDLQFLLSE